jgi:hypothetical protein
VGQRAEENLDGRRDLNGEFNSSDLVSVFTAGKYETGNSATWSEGDFNGDKLFSSGDLVTAFQGPRAAVNAVPEPTSIVLGLVWLLCVVKTFRQPAACSSKLFRL